ncbi:M16 family metallopeptidase [Tunturibacter empetritectus]|uniref:Zinc protease n=1 Tax=Tunturiibacter empetritectus TaxID=3069691 RepID=A0A7W8IIB8_9BACT|nr:pitrilysin family protein [Edaphobacter lichenicola]MBB5316830.1 zinc protease [Edaphobacter lichenicola]
MTPLFAFKKIAAATLLCGLASASMAFAANDLPAAKPLKLPELKYEKYTLPNGLVILTHEDHRLPLVAIDLWYHVGPLNERAGRTGFAHLFEHMMFEGSEHVGEKAHFKYLEGAGATDINGTTDFDRTNYFETLPSNQLELGLWLESDRMGFLLEGLDRVKLTNQRDVVRNERRQGEGTPYALADEQAYHMLFPHEHPYYASVIGSHADIEAARINDIRDFHQHFYTPNNASIAIAGDFDPAKLKALLTKYFGPIPQGPAVEPVTVKTPPITTQKRATVTDSVQLPRLSVAWLTPPVFTPGDAETDLLVHILGGGKASRLYRKLVYEQQVAQTVTCNLNALKLGSIADCDITAKPGVSLDTLEAALWKEVASLQSDGPTQAELDRARTVDVTAKITGLQRLGGFGGVADTLDRYNQFLDDPGYLPKDIARYQAATVASVKQAATQYLGKDQSVVVNCVPGKKVVDDVPRSPDNTDADVKLTAPYTAQFEDQQNWRKTAPAPGPTTAFHLPVPKTFTLANGLQVYLLEDHSLPVYSAAVVARAGSESDSTAKAGLAGFTARLLTEGTTQRSATTLADNAEQIGTTLTSTADVDSANASLSALSNNTEAGLDLLSDVIEHPAFAPEEVERIRKQRLVAILQEGDQPVASVLRVGFRTLYGDHPYGIRSIGNTDGIKSITRDDIATFWQAHYGPKDSALVLAGDVNESEVKHLADKYFAPWSASAATATAVPPAPAPPGLKIVIVDKPGAPQTALYAIGLGLPRTTPDYPAVMIMNNVLGGLFASRINMNLREEHGYTYGASSGFMMYRTGGPFYSGAQVRTDVTAPAAKQLMLELNRIRTEPPTEAELKLAKDSLLHSLPGDFETTKASVGGLRQIFIYSLPTDYFAKLPARFEAVTPAEVAKAAQTDVHPDQLILMAVGDRAKIEPGLKELNLGPIEYRDTTGNIIK